MATIQLGKEYLGLFRDLIRENDINGMTNLLIEMKSKLDEKNFQKIVVVGMKDSIIHKGLELCKEFLKYYKKGSDKHDQVPILHKACDSYVKSEIATDILILIWDKYPDLWNNFGYRDKNGFTAVQRMSLNMGKFDAKLLEWVKIRIPLLLNNKNIPRTVLGYGMLPVGASCFGEYQTEIIQEEVDDLSEIVIQI